MILTEEFRQKFIQQNKFPRPFNNMFSQFIRIRFSFRHHIWTTSQKVQVERMYWLQTFRNCMSKFINFRHAFPSTTSIVDSELSFSFLTEWPWITETLFKSTSIFVSSVLTCLLRTSFNANESSLVINRLYQNLCQIVLEREVPLKWSQRNVN